mgnify:CR=1 FL=1
MDYSELDTTSNSYNDIIVPGTIESDTRWDYSYPYLSFGTVADNYWVGHCQVYDRNAKFEINDLYNIKDFTLNKVGFDDYLWIKLNGETIYVGPDGGDSIELTSQQSVTGIRAVTNGEGNFPCERSTNWQFTPEIDLKPYLIQGENELWTRTIVSGWGESWLNIRAIHKDDNN